MWILRKFLLGHRPLAAVLLALTLCLKIVVPAGYMLQSQDRVLVVSLCGDGTMQQTRIVLPGQHDDSQAAKAKGSCSFAGHGAPMLGGADPLILALALVFVLALGFAPQAAPRLTTLAHLRPPLRGPPAFT